jgi:uncharacterized membrane protein (UPF0127 family)
LGKTKQSIVKKLIALASIALLAIFMFWQSFGAEELDANSFAFKTANDTHVFNLKIAKNLNQHSNGLMFVESLPEKEGMLFVNPKPVISSFWMKNTYIPLDILFVDEIGKIVHIHHNATPLDENTLITSPSPVKYIVELNGGICEKLGIEVADILDTKGL